MMNLSDPSTIHFLNNTLQGMSEKQARLFLAEIARQNGYGGFSSVASTFHVSRGRIMRGIQELESGEVFHCGDRNRKPGGGRKTVEEHYRRAILNAGLDEKLLPEVLDIHAVIRHIVEFSIYGDPMTSRKWINVTVRAIAEEVESCTGQHYSHSSIKKILRVLGFSLQKNQKYQQVGKAHPERNDQYQHIVNTINHYLKSGNPVISVDTKSKEKLGAFIRTGREYRYKGNPRHVLDHDFALKFTEIYPEGNPQIPEEMMGTPAVVVPYGIYCLNNNAAHVTLGISHDTSEFAANSILNWWKARGCKEFATAKRLLILADGGGSNRARGNLWKNAVQQLSDDLGLTIEVCHYPPGCSKHNPIEHRLWSQVSRNWSARPLENLEIVMEYVRHTATTTGLTVSCEIDYHRYLTEPQKAECEKNGTYYTGISKSEGLESGLLLTSKMKTKAMRMWNYTVRPHSRRKRWVSYKIPA